MNEIKGGKAYQTNSYTNVLTKHKIGEMAEWLNALPWKGSMGETSSGVRIPLSPQNNKHNAKALCDCVLRERGGFERRSRYTRRVKRVLVGESGSRTLSRFGVVDEQIYLVIRDRIPL